jgi:hypothetical protein
MINRNFPRKVTSPDRESSTDGVMKGNSPDGNTRPEKVFFKLHISLKYAEHYLRKQNALDYFKSEKEKEKWHF